MDAASKFSERLSRPYQQRRQHRHQVLRQADQALRLFHPVCQLQIREYQADHHLAPGAMQKNAEMSLMRLPFLI